MSIGLSVLASCFAAPSCRTPQQHLADADEQVYEILAERRAELGSDDRPFRVQAPTDALRSRILESGLRQIGPLDLLECLEIAAENSRTFQDRRESLYLAALDLTLERYRFSNQYSAGLGGMLSGSGDEANDVSVDGGLGLTRLLGSGASIVADVGTSLFRNLANGDGWDAVTSAALSVTQPLLAGSSREIVRENLTQAERDVLYEVRSYERFRRTLAVDVADRYLGLLQQMDAVSNQQLNIESLTLLRERNEALSEAGRLSDIQLDQAREQELRSLNGLINAQQRLEDQLDSFKLFLGLPIDVLLDLDESGLEGLEEGTFAVFEERQNDLMNFAMSERLDHLTVVDRVVDRERAVVIAEDALRARASLVASASADSVEGKPLTFRKKDLGWSLGLDLDLPIDRFPERNAYRAALLSLDLAVRNVDESSDGIRVSLRASAREVTATLEQLEIQRSSVALNERRVESARLNQEAGRAQTRDILEAEEDLLAARNAATGALIDHYLARLALMRDLELLRVDEERGVWFDLELLETALETSP